MAAEQPTMLERLLGTMPQTGQVRWIGLRPGRGEPLEAVTAATAAPGKGLDGDRFKGTPASKRQVTLIQHEHLAAVAGILGREAIDPSLTRRNIVVSGINLYALRHATFRVGEVLLQGTGICAPCRQMEQALGAGGFNAMRGHGGITSRVLEPGTLRIDDPVALVEAGALARDET